jgi:hypothetical protein
MAGFKLHKSEVDYIPPLTKAERATLARRERMKRAVETNNGGINGQDK